MAERVKTRFKPFKTRTKVWLETKNLRLQAPHGKLTHKREGPFEIEKVLGPLVYHLKLLKKWRIHPVFHANLLTPYQETQTHGPNFLKPPPDLIDAEEEYEVESIINHRRRYGKIQYLIRWKGYPLSDSSWEPTSNLTHAKSLLQAYKRRHKLN